MHHCFLPPQILLEGKKRGVSESSDSSVPEEVGEGQGEGEGGGGGEGGRAGGRWKWGRNW